MGVLLGASIHHLPAAKAQMLTGRSYFPGLIAAPFEAGLRKAFDFAALACLVAAAASWLSGEKYVHSEPGDGRDGGDPGQPAVAAASAAGNGADGGVGPRCDARARRAPARTGRP